MRLARDAIGGGALARLLARCVRWGGHPERIEIAREQAQERVRELDEPRVRRHRPRDPHRDVLGAVAATRIEARERGLCRRCALEVIHRARERAREVGDGVVVVEVAHAAEHVADLGAQVGLAARGRRSHERASSGLARSLMPTFSCANAAIRSLRRRATASMRATRCSRFFCCCSMATGLPSTSTAASSAGKRTWSTRSSNAPCASGWQTAWYETPATSSRSACARTRSQTIVKISRPSDPRSAVTRAVSSSGVQPSAHAAARPPAQRTQVGSRSPSSYPVPSRRREV